MSNLDDVPALSPEAKAFLRSHAQTGEPDAEALERGRSRLHRPVYRTAKIETRARPVRAAPNLKAFAAAAMVALVAGSGVLLLMTDWHPSESPIPPIIRIMAAYDSGNLDEALSVAQHCYEPRCLQLYRDIEHARTLIDHVEMLQDAQLEELLAIDSAIRSVEGGVSAYGPRSRVAPPSRQTGSEARAVELELLIDSARLASRRGHQRGAVSLLNRCLMLDSASLACTRQLASAYASMAQNGDRVALRQAREYYLRYLRIAPSDDPYVPKVRNILESAPPE